MNIADIVVGGMIVVAVILALRKIYSDRKNGKVCGGNCSGCTMDCAKK